MVRIAIVLALLLTGSAVAQEVELKWKWREKDSFETRTLTKIKQTLVVEDVLTTFRPGSFELTTTAFQNLEKAKVPAEVLTSLKPLTGQKFEGREATARDS